MTRPEGWEVPVHRSLLEPPQIAGLPRRVGLVLWTSVGAFVFGMQQIWMLPAGILVHLGAAALARRDPHIFDVALLALRLPRRLDP